VLSNWSSKNGGFADGLVTLPRKTKYSKAKTHIEHMPQKRKKAKASTSTARPTSDIILSDCDKIKYEQR